MFLTLTRLFEKGVMFLFFVLLAKNFGKESFGEFSYYFTIASIVFVIFDVGGEFYQIREFTKHESLKIFQNIFILKSCIAILVLAIALIMQQHIYLLLLISSFYLDSIISVFRSSLYKNSLYVQECLLTLTEKTVFIALVLLNLITIDGIIIMYVAFVVAKLIYLLVAMKRFYRLKFLFSTFNLYNAKFLKIYAYGSWSYVLHALLVIVFVQIDIVMLKQMGVPFDEIGLYSAAAKIYFAVIIFADVLFKQYYPKVAMYLHNEDTFSLQAYILKIQSLNIYFSVVLSFITMLFSRQIIAISFGADFEKSSNMLILLSVVIVFRFSMYTYTALLSSSNLNRIKLLTSISCVLVNVVLNYILIPQYGVYGALFATLVTELVLVVMYKISSFKIIFTNYFTVKEFFCLTSALLSAWFFFNFDIEIVYKIIILICFATAAFLSRNRLKSLLSFEGI